MKAHNLWEWVMEGAARVDAGKVAVVSSHRALTFGELIEGARGIAAALSNAGIGRGSRVGIWMEKTPQCVQAILGVLAVGAAYVPLDPRAPWRRCRTIALDCDLQALTVDGPRLSRVPEIFEGRPPRLVLVDDTENEVRTDELAFPYESLSQAIQWPTADLPSARPEDVAYILYTSGSTGIPKGVVHTHASGLAFTRWVVERFETMPNDIFSSHAPFHFDLSILDLYASLGSGASVRLISSVEGMLGPWLVKMIPTWGITVWYSVPSILIAMLDSGLLEPQGLPTVRLLFFAGEVFPTPQLRRLRRAVPQARLFNLFGPTETNVCTYYEVPSNILDGQTIPIPIGHACEHMETFVMDDAGKEVGTGIEGILWAKGPNLMRGYWNDEVRTAATLQPDPRGAAGLAYCTGDRVVLQSDGTYQFRGRRDHMIKIRGYRIELGEVESALAAHPDVLEAVAVPLEDQFSGTRLVASVLPCTGTHPEPEALRAFARQYLPIYMIPEQLEVRSSMPRTSSGKADRTALRSEWEAKERA